MSAGVAVMARPPGKKNSTIHLLSGGEKALTAVALVFSIFDLNPAPFCLLDEVDAPLDEHNVGRFCDIVRDMSTRVQFIFITHNKTTMELASQLLGVTMHEPGVSRLVAVDVDEAVQARGRLSIRCRQCRNYAGHCSFLEWCSLPLSPGGSGGVRVRPLRRTCVMRACRAAMPSVYRAASRLSPGSRG